MDPKTLSSPKTFFTKFVATPVIIFAAVAIGVSVWKGPLRGSDHGIPSDPFTWALVLIWLGVLPTIGTTLKLKQVRIDSTTLYVSNYFKEISVPLGNVKDVTEKRRTAYHPVTVHFRSATDFGNEVAFMPGDQGFGGFGQWRPHPIVDEIKQRASLSIVRTSDDA